jgi:hypothetical protein
MKMPDPLHHPASFRDPSGFMFLLNGQYYRQVNQCYAGDYELLMQSGLYRELTEKRWLISHEPVEENLTGHPDWYMTLLPQQLLRISYASEWCPDQLRDAGLLTLHIMEAAIARGMILKDASPSNIQFVDGKPLFIDSLSFEKYDTSMPWVAYRQFCECFVFPLYLQRYLGTGLRRILGAYPEGVPAAVTGKLLPLRSRLNAGAWLHVMMLGRVRRDVAVGKAGGGDDRSAGGAGGDAGARNDGGGRSAGSGRRLSFDQKKMRNLIQHLKDIISRWDFGDRKSSEWSDYYGRSILSKEYLAAKEKLFLEFMGEIDFASALDLGANNGHFSKLLAQHGAEVIAVDYDWQCINELYLSERKERAQGAGEKAPMPGGKMQGILPLCVDIADPTPAAGFRHAERASFTERMRAELVAGLALVHHLVLGKNIPLGAVALYFAELSLKYLIIEFVPISDEKAQELTRNKSRWHVPYDAENFEKIFGGYFDIRRKETIPGTERILYLMRKKDITG